MKRNVKKRKIEEIWQEMENENWHTNETKLMRKEGKQLNFNEKSETKHLEKQQKVFWKYDKIKKTEMKKNE